jgi:hypothetical protein
MITSSIWESYEEIKRRQQDIREDFRMFQLPIGTAVDIAPEKRFGQDHQIPEVAPLWAVHAEGKLFRVSQPIRVHVFRDGNLFFAENETLLVCGTGDSAWEAVEDLELHIIHFYNYYKELPSDRVMGEAKRLKAIYRDLLVEEQ